MKRLQDENLGEPIIKLFFDVVEKIGYGSGQYSGDCFEKVSDVTGLTKREATILLLRYQSNGEVKNTYDEVGKHVGVTRERIRQIKLQALRKIRYHGKIQSFLDFLDIKKDYSDWVSENYICD
jgi:DNA-binding CsgD family transcriptional regulator